jgi:hypothetical protein
MVLQFLLAEPPLARAPQNSYHRRSFCNLVATPKISTSDPLLSALILYHHRGAALRFAARTAVHWTTHYLSNCHGEMPLCPSALTADSDAPPLIRFILPLS